MPHIQLNFINNSNDTNNSQVVIFQKNEAFNFGERPVAWKTIDNVGRGYNHPFTFSLQNDVVASDSWGNFTPIQSAAEGRQFNVIQSASGAELKAIGTIDGNQVHVINDLVTGAINAHIFKDGKLLATKTGLARAKRRFLNLNLLFG